MARRHRKHRNPVRRHRRAHRNPAHRRRHHYRNPMNMGGIGKDLAVALIAGGGAYFIARAGEKFLGTKMPAMVPANLKAPVANGLLALAGIVLAETVLKGKPGAKVAVAAGFSIPLAESLVNMTPLGAMLGTQRVIMLPPPAKTDGTQPGNMSATLAAQLDAALDDPYEGSY
jgi:hypothetical protein